MGIPLWTVSCRHANALSLSGFAEVQGACQLLAEEEERLSHGANMLL